MNTFLDRGQKGRVKQKKRKEKRYPTIHFKGATTLKSHVLVVTCNTF
jgi:hypothetical protein